MFKKPLANQLRFSALRSSDRRRLVQEVSAQFPALAGPGADDSGAVGPGDRGDDDEPEAADSHGGQCARAAGPVPEKVSQAKWTAHGEAAFGILYIDADSKQPAWFRCGAALVPTVYTMWKFPDMLPTIATWEPVIDKLMNGADLMLPGLTVPPAELPQLRTGDLVAIVADGARIPVGVGTMAVNVADITELRGKGVHMLHIYKDFLWALGDKSEPPDTPELKEAATAKSVEKGKQEIMTKISDSAQAAEGVETLRLAVALEDPEKQDSNADESCEAKVLCSQEDMDEYVEQSFLQALSVNIGQAGASQLPLSTSTFFSEFMMPSRPIPEPLDMKHTKWKKLSKFLKGMEKEKIIKLKDVRGDLQIQSVNWTHPKIADFVPHKTPRAVTAARNAALSKPSTATTTTLASGAPMEITVLYRPKASSSIFPARDNDAEKLYSVQDLRDVINEYVKLNGLAVSSNKRMVKIDAVLRDALMRKEEYHAVDVLPRDELWKRLAVTMEVSHRLSVAGKELVIRKGEPRPIEILVQNTHGHKIVTRITGLETFLICPELAAKELTKACACSVAVTPLPGKTKGPPHVELMVQGPQQERLSSYIVGKGVPKKYIEVVDKTKKK